MTTQVTVPKSHPRYESLRKRETLIRFYEQGLVAKAGLIAHGRGEAFDYLLGERTIPEGEAAVKAAAAHLLQAKNPVISVNGNVAALAGEEIVRLSKTVPAKLEVNIFYRTEGRLRKIVEHLETLGGGNILGLKPDKRIDGLDHPRAHCTNEGIYTADVILVPLEDGDRALALKDMGKKVLTVDLNPLSRTAMTADVTIVDEVTRCVPKIIEQVNMLKGRDEEIKGVIESFDNDTNLQSIRRHIAERLPSLNKI